MSTGTLTSVAQDYIKVVWGLQEWSDAPVTTKDLAERLGVGPSTVSETVRRLVSQGLLDHERYGAIHLTEQGRRHALDMVRRHRLIETFLVQHLGYTWDEVHDEAEVLEHAVSDLMVHRIDEALGHPTRDPHGDPIPSANLALTQPAALTLTVLPEGRPEPWHESQMTTPMCYGTSLILGSGLTHTFVSTPAVTLLGSSMSCGHQQTTPTT